MKLIKFVYKPTLRIRLAEDELNVLWACAKSHYDRRCKLSIEPGGCLSRWSCEFSCESLSATLDDIDLAAKILEQRLGCEVNDKTRVELQRQMLMIMRRGNEEYCRLNVDIKQNIAPLGNEEDIQYANKVVLQSIRGD